MISGLPEESQGQVEPGASPAGQLLDADPRPPPQVDDFEGLLD
jgi:hypothetical protein